MWVLKHEVCWGRGGIMKISTKDILVLKINKT